MMVPDVEQLMAALSATRPIFHSEADFQHALAWHLQLDRPQSAVRLETRPERGVHLDVLVADGQHRTAIELKYLTDRFSGLVGSEHFDLPRQAAHPISRHDVCKDLWRLEAMVDRGFADVGLAIVLSNDGAYWRAGIKEDPIDVLFRLDHGRTIGGSLAWAASAGPGTTRKRTETILLRSNYQCTWRPYSRIQTMGRDTEFRYLGFVVTPATPPAAL